MKFIAAILLLVLVTCTSEKRSDVLYLKDDNFDAAIKKYDTILVQFYTSWCSRCRKFDSDYEKAAKQLKKRNPPMYLARVDATLNPMLTQRYKISEFPTLKLFRKGRVIDYDYDLKKDDIIDFMNDKVEFPSTHYKLARDLKDVISRMPIVLVGYFDKTVPDENSEWYDVASSVDFITAVHVTDAEVAKEMKATVPSIVIYKTLDHAVVFDGEPGELKRWVYLRSLPSIVPHVEQFAKALFSPEVGITLQLLVFSSTEALKEKKDILEAIATTFYGKLFVVTIPSEDFKLYEYFRVDPNKLPVLLLADFSKDPMVKYRFEGEFSKDAITEFINNFFAGSLKGYFLSDEELEQEGNVVRLVGKSFNEVAYDPLKNVFVKFYAPWCMKCKTLAPVYEQLAEEYSDSDSVVIAEMDVTRNEVEGVVIRGFPTLILYKAGGDGKESVIYDGKYTLESMKEFIDVQSVFITDENEEL